METMQTISAPEVLDIDHAAEFLMISNTVLYGLAQKRKVPAKKVGGQWRFLRSSLIEWMKNDNSTKLKIKVA